MKDISKSHRDLKKIFNDFPSIVFIINDNYNFDYSNRMGANLLGYKGNEILNMSFIELLTPDSLEKCIDSIRQLRNTGFYQSPSINLLRKNGEILSLELSGIRLNDGRFFFVGRNLSIERLRKEKMVYLEELNKNIINSIDEGIIVLDKNGNIINYNYFMEKKYNWKRKKFIGKNVFNLMPELKEQRLVETFVNIIDRTATKICTNIFIYDDNNNIILVNLRGYPLKKGSKTIGAIIIIEDITEREEKTKKIKKTEIMREKTNQIIQSIIPLNTVPEIIKEFTSALNKKLGYERGGIFIFDKDKEEPIYVKIFSSRNTIPQLKAAKKKILAMLKKKKGIITNILKTGKPMIINDIKKEKCCVRIFSDTRGEMCIPIKIKNEILGVITIDNMNKVNFDKIDMRYAEILANNIAIILEKTRFQEEVKEKLQNLSTFYEISQILSQIQERVLKYDKLFQYINNNIPGFTTLILRFDSNNITEIASSKNATKGIIKTFTEMGVTERKQLIAKLKTRNPFKKIIGGMKPSLFTELNKKGIKTIYTFPFIVGGEVIGCFVLLNRKSIMLQTDQISFLKAVVNLLSPNLPDLIITKK